MNEPHPRFASAFEDLLAEVAKTRSVAYQTVAAIAALTNMFGRMWRNDPMTNSGVNSSSIRLNTDLARTSIHSSRSQ